MDPDPAHGETFADDNHDGKNADDFLSLEADDDADVDNTDANASADDDVTETKKISRVESLKNLILHGKTEPDLPPEVFNFPHGCSCR